MNKISKLIRLFLRFPEVKRSINFLFDGYLYEEGWFVSYLEKKSVNSKKEPIPWWTYPFNDFIKDRLKSSFYVFEWGSGSSTIFLTKKVKFVFSVEHSKEWYDYLSLELEKENCKNVNLIFKELSYNGDYSRVINGLENDFDIIIIDGRDRVNCCINSLSKLKEDGVIIFDDSDRIEYIDAYNFLSRKGFKRIDFWGISAGYMNKKCTTIFYREKNCLNI